MILAMYIVSGLNKILSLGKSEGPRFASRTGIPPTAATVLVFLAGVLEVAASAVVIYGIRQKVTKLVDVGVLMLVAFTVVASFVFYAFPFRYKPILANMTAIGGLLMLSCMCTKNSKP